tara:strand:+ start:11732 stop:13195 length:1464 start_codon:yes stop_codon:yes gene_type:complete
MNDINIKLPKIGLSRDLLLNKMRTYAADDSDWKSGKTWSLVYNVGNDHTEMLKEAHSLYFSENALNPLAFKSLKKFEHEIIQMSLGLLHGDAETVGTLSSGGSESILMAVKTSRDAALKQKPWIKKPEIILPESAHVTFVKAAHYFDLKTVLAPLKADFTVDTDKIERLINKNTILLVGSAPQYPQGIIDPIEIIGDIALKHKLFFHVDACLGGFLLPFLEKLNYDIPKFDFRVTGVTSISADLHKYGYAAKGVSVILYRNMDLLKHQFFIYEKWSGGLYASPGMLGSRPGGPIAAAWAAMQSLGEKGYFKLAAKTMGVAREMMEEINNIPELSVLGKPQMPVFVFGSNSSAVNIFAVADQMEKNGWHIDRQNNPDCIHIIVSPAHSDSNAKFITDLKNCIHSVKNNPNFSTEGSAAMYGMMSAFPVGGMVKKNILKMMCGMYGPEGKIPNLSSEEGESEKDISMRIGKGLLKSISWLQKLKHKILK